MKKTNIITLGGLLAALSVVLMFLTNFIPVASLALPAIAGVLLISVVIEAGAKWAFLIYAVVAILSMLLLGDKSPAIYYIFFFGHYPMFKNFIERLKNKPAQWLVKILLFNVCAVAAYTVAVLITGVTDRFPIYDYLIAFAVANVTFVIYDFAVSRLIILYVYRLHKMFFK